MAEEDMPKCRSAHDVETTKRGIFTGISSEYIVRRALEEIAEKYQKFGRENYSAFCNDNFGHIPLEGGYMLSPTYKKGANVLLQNGTGRDILEIDCMMLTDTHLFAFDACSSALTFNHKKPKYRAMEVLNTALGEHMDTRLLHVVFSAEHYKPFMIHNLEHAIYVPRRNRLVKPLARLLSEKIEL